MQLLSNAPTRRRVRYSNNSRDILKLLKKEVREGLKLLLKF
jgi:hypothetical protein